MKDLAWCKKAYWAAKSNAKQRGKEWKYTLQEWVSWWEETLGANWLEKRGRNKSSYVMARIGDTGPYSPENVKCLTNSENGYDRRLNGVAARAEQKAFLLKNRSKKFILQLTHWDQRIEINEDPLQK